MFTVWSSSKCLLASLGPLLYYDNKDTYGNKDLVPATRAMQIVDRAIKALQELPEEYRDFYARRVVSKVKDKCERSVI